MDDLFMTMADPKTFTNMFYFFKNAIALIFSNPGIIICITYPVGLIVLAIVFLIKNNLSFIKVFFAENANVLMFFNKWYEKALFLKVLIVYNIFFLLVGLFHIFMAKLYWFKSIDFAETYITKSIAPDNFSVVSIFFITLFVVIFFTTSFNIFRNLPKTEVIFSILLCIGVLSILVQLTDIFLVYIGITIVS